MENALGLSGYQALMMTIVFALGFLGIAGLLLALFWPQRWRLKYRIEVGFIIILLGLVWYADNASSKIFTQYQNAIRESGSVSADTVNPNEVFDRKLRVIAFQWGFAFLTDDDKISRNVAIVKSGEKVLFRIFSNDVIHGFNIPAVGMTIEFDPGAERSIWIRAPKEPGKYLIQCLNYCGVGHAQMKAWLVVEGK